jgi:hypothetical protein
VRRVGENRRVNPKTYPLAATLRARLMGTALVLIGLLLVVATIVVFATGLPLDLLSAIVLLVVVAVFALGWLLVRRWYVLRLDDVGYRVRFVRGAGVNAARWADVLDATTATVAGSRCLVLRLRAGGTTTVPVDAIEGDPEELVREFGRRLQAAG